MATDVSFKPMGSQITTRKSLERLADVDPRLTRSYYFDNRLLTAEDLNRDQLYVDGRLREVGQTLGYGILNGLDVDLDQSDGTISVTPGLAVTRAGRVLELGRRLTLDLGERAEIMELNEGRSRRFDRALYAIIVKYAEVGTDIAEVFPTDLADKRGFQYDVISEGVQLALVRLRFPLAQQNPLHIRASLMQRMYGDNTADGFIPEDAVALGILAISNDRPQWLDAELLRQPLRADAEPGDLQQDMSRRYQNIFNDIMDARRNGSLNGDFAATEYFRLLPPVGSLPKESLNPVAGRQGYFPENYNVWTAPVRKSDVELIMNESMVLPPIDLLSGEPMDIIVLAPLSNSDYGHYAQRLERPLNTETRKLPAIDLLRLRLYPRRPVHELNTDEATWQAIWDTVEDDDLIYIRRPLRAAETRVSGIVLAQGIDLPSTPPEESTPTPADGGLLQDEDSVFLNRINVTSLSNLRMGESTASSDAVADMETEFANDAFVLQQTLSIFLRVERDYDEQIWQTVLSLARAEQLPAFLQALIEGQDDDTLTGNVVANIGASFGLDAGLVSEWSSAVPS
jgi:hypothetical protein